MTALLALLEVRDLLIEREGRTVLDVEHLSVSRGEVLAVVGPNGAGKSTLFLALARLLQARHGEICFDGRSLNELPALEYRRRIALVLQEPLLMDLSVRENVALGLKFRGLPAAEIERQVAPWLDRLGIAHLADRRGKQLSGGEAQRVSLARAFILKPELLLLDEPFSSLDSPSRARLAGDLGTLLKETSTTSIFITHDLQEALTLASRLAVILEGRLCQVGSPREVMEAPASADVAAFLGIRGI